MIARSMLALALIFALAVPAHETFAARHAGAGGGGGKRAQAGKKKGPKKGRAGKAAGKKRL